MLATLLAAVSLAASAPAAAGWAPNDISVSRSAPGEPASFSTHFEVAPDGDARVAVERREGGRRTAGTILLIGGRWMLTRGFAASTSEIDSLDRAALDSQLIIVLLTAAFPDGPPAPGEPHHVRFAEKTNPIRMTTASTAAEYRAPWTVVGTVTVPAAEAAANYQLSFTYSDQGVAHTVDFAGSAGTTKSPLDLPDSTKLAGWKVRRLPQSLESSLTAAPPQAASAEDAQRVATLGELRQLR